MKEGAHGFSAGAALIGREMKSLPDTVATVASCGMARNALWAFHPVSVIA